MRFPLAVLAAVWATAILMAIVYFPMLPSRVASHFDAAGNANGWSSRGSFVVQHVGISTLITFVFAGIAMWLQRIPVSMVNLPNREHWLAPERREASMRWIERHLLWFAAAMMALLQLVFAFTYRSNAAGSGRMAPHLMWPALGAILGVAAWFLVAIYRRFSRPA